MLVIDIALGLNTVRLKDGRSLRTRYTLLIEYLKRECCLDLFVLTYIIFEEFDVDSEVKPICSLVALSALLFKFKQKGDLIRRYFAFKKWISLVDSVLLLLAASHLNVTLLLIQALLLYLSSKFIPERSWVSHIGIQDSSWGVKYIYSLYWSVTTIVTVGYGDITPQN